MRLATSCDSDTRFTIFFMFATSSYTSTVKSRQSAPTSSTLQVGRGGWASPTCRIQCYMKKYSPYENCTCTSYTDQRSRARGRTDPTKRRVCAIDPLSGGWALLRTFPTGSSTRLQFSTASQTATESYEDQINHVLDKKSGRGRMGETGRSGGILR